jgi:GH24 family phage-related lysozyme (muramidase)
MNLSHKGYTQIRSKGFRAKPYKDPYGNLRIGYGHIISEGDGVAQKDLINVFKANELLENDIARVTQDVLRIVPSNVTQEEFDAMVVRAYHLMCLN